MPSSGMPELPDIEAYLVALGPRIMGQPLERVRLGSPFLLRTVEPPLAATYGRPVQALRRLGKRIALGLEGELWLLIHLMIAGRLQWQEAGAKLPGRRGLAAFDFPTGTLVLTEAGTKRRAALHLVRGEAALRAHDPGGIEVLTCDRARFAATLRRENHTLKRALTDPHLFSGIGNAYSDEILHRSGLSPVALSGRLDEGAITRLHDATRAVLGECIERLSRSAAEQFPAKVTAFHPEMAVHGRYGKPCPVCASPVQRIRYADNETSYCARCQTGGKLLADRALSRLLGKDWPRDLDEFEERRLSSRG